MQQEQMKPNAAVVIAIFDQFFSLVTQRSMPGEIVAFDNDARVLYMTRTMLREFINERLKEQQYATVSQNSAVWQSLLNARIQESSDLRVDMDIADGRHAMASGRITGKSQRLTLLFNPHGART